MEFRLSDLRDIHLPKEPSWFPPALGWWLVLGGVFIFALFVFLMYLYWYTRPKQYALRELERIHKSEKNSVAMARYISILLKRVALLMYPQKNVATLTEEKWVDFLQEETGQTFSDAQLTLLAFAAYMPDNKLTEVDPTALYRAAGQGIRLLFKEKKHGSKN